MNAQERLTRDLVDLASQGARPPCGDYGGHQLWTSDLAEDRQLAADRCQTCPLLKVCAQAADESGEKWHVWGGVDRTTSPRRKTPPIRTQED